MVAGIFIYIYIHINIDQVDMCDLVDMYQHFQLNFESSVLHVPRTRRCDEVKNM
jgi:hypothetical protein